MATIEMRPLGRGHTELTFHMEFTPGMRLLGLVMAPMIKAQFRKALGKLLDANKAYVEDGVVIARAASGQ